MHRSVRFVLQPYKSRNPPLAAVTQARRDANSGSYGYKAVVTKQPLNRGCPVPDIAHAPDQIRTSPRKLPACSCGNLSLQRMLRTSSLNIILHFSSLCNMTNSRNIHIYSYEFYAYLTIIALNYLQSAQICTSVFVSGGNIGKNSLFKMQNLKFFGKRGRITPLFSPRPARLRRPFPRLPRGAYREICKNPREARRAQ